MPVVHGISVALEYNNVVCWCVYIYITYDTMDSFGQHIMVDDNGNAHFIIFDYLEFYDEKVRSRLTDEEGREIYDGLTIDEFINGHCNDILEAITKKVITDKRLEKLQDELIDEGKQVCMINLYVLCMYLVERNRKHYVFLLKPTIGETLAELKNVVKVTFTNDDGTTVESSSKLLITKILEMMEANKEIYATNKEFMRLVTWDKLANNAIMQSCFVYDLSQFMNKYFSVKRKKDATVSTKEVELIMYLLKFFGLSKVELTNKRYWQLMNTYKRIKPNLDLCSFPTGDGDHIEMPATFMPYSLWRKGKTNWTEDDVPNNCLKIGDTIKFYGKPTVEE